ncbi:MAG: mannonate dehydratase [Candidatus Puniceispirillum sp.]|jgi:mannonate dehydratase|uniref:mannonate dehydratase n=1 Tax=uncultured Candidatus Puniceispirillum sp. TaxID=1985115 RepID=UPI002A6CD60F|nr:mannonate dehydratase [Candidatus Puniceispirillum sp.]MBT6566619.1 mannonate dehydratase [Candidatus Puniceispirillum sp.]
MIEAWRWFGPLDKITLPEITQTGASGIVSALHEIPYGEIWPVDAISTQQKMVANTGLLDWMVVESLPIHERIKRGEGDLSTLFANYRQSMANLAACGIYTICYNFMPLLDWTRTTLDAPVKGGGMALRFDRQEMAIFEIFMLERDGAEADYTPEIVDAAKQRFDQMKQNDKDRLLASIMAGLPGAFDRYSISQLRDELAKYKDIDRDSLRANYSRFLHEVIPTATTLGMRLCVHPDDPPRDVLGLPRIVSSHADIAWIMDEVDNMANGLTLCSGSLGASPDNDVPQIAAEFADRIHFAHLRNVSKDADGSFQEAAHLDGDVDMVALVKALMNEEKRRRQRGRADHQIVFRPDHGHELLSDIGRGTHPGYPLIGRMRGLAELRGIIHALAHEQKE